MLKFLFAMGMVTLLPSIAYAYIGPGAAAGTIAVVLGVIAAVLMAIVGLVWYPVKRLLRSRKPEKPAVETSQSATDK